MLHTVSRIAFVAALAWAAMPAQAQQAENAPGANTPDSVLDEIVVTATRSATTLQTTPAVVNVISGETIENLRVDDIENIANFVPGLKLDANVSFQSRLGLRGAITTGDTPSLSQSVGLYIDGIFISRAVGLLAEVRDLDRIEVLRGPQGTLFGRNVIGGAVSLVTKDPGQELDGRINFGFGSYGALEGGFRVAGPLTSELAAEISGSYRKTDGWVRNIVTGNLLDQEEDYSARTKAVWDHDPVRLEAFFNFSSNSLDGIPRHAIASVITRPEQCAIGPSTFIRTQLRAAGYTTAQINAQIARICAGGATADPVRFRPIYASEDKFKTIRSTDGSTSSKSYLAGLTGRWNIQDRITLESITGYSFIDSTAKDFDFLIDPVLGLLQDIQTTNRTAQQEFRLFGQGDLFGRTNAFDWQLGVFLYYDKVVADAQSRSTETVNAPEDVFGVAFGGVRPGPFEAPFRPSHLVDPFVSVRNGNPPKRANTYESTTTHSYAAFAQTTVRPLDWLGLTLGGRYTIDDLQGKALTVGDAFDDTVLSTPPCFFFAKADDPALDKRLQALAAVSPIVDAISVNSCQQAAPLDVGFGRFTYKGLVDLTFADVGPFNSLLFYGSVATGYKSGSLEFRSSIFDSSILPPERVFNLEAGFKTSFLDRRVAFNATIFKADYTDLQTLSVPTGENRQGGAATRGVSVDAEAWGVETELQFLVARGLSVGAFYSYLHGRIDDGETIPAFNGAPIEIGGNILPQAPEHSVSVSFNFEREVGSLGVARVSSQYSYESFVCYSVENSRCIFEVLRDASEQRTWDAEIGLRRGPFEIAGFVKNILDDAPLLRALAGPTTAQLHPFESFGVRKQLFGGLIGRPRLWGVSLKYRFGPGN